MVQGCENPQLDPHFRRAPRVSYRVGEAASALHEPGTLAVLGFGAGGATVADPRMLQVALESFDAPPPLEGGARMNSVLQARLLRYGTALAMLGREADLAQLRARYASAFAGLPTAAAFSALTDKVGAVDPAALSAAMAAIPSASPAGGIADLIDAAPAIVSQH